MAIPEDMQLTPTSFIVLGLLDWLGPASPYRLKRTLQNSISDFHRIPHTTMYSEPARLAAAGYLDETQEGEGRRRKRYAITNRGRDALRAWLANPEAEPTEVRSPALLKVFFGADPEPLAQSALAYHRELLAFFEGVRGPEIPAGPANALETGIAYHRFWIDQWQRLARAKKK